MGARRAKSQKTKRKNGLKAQLLNDTVEASGNFKKNQKLAEVAAGNPDAAKPAMKPKNAFLHPKDPDAIIPKAKFESMQDMRSDAVTGHQVKLIEKGVKTKANRRKEI